MITDTDATDMGQPPALALTKQEKPAAVQLTTQEWKVLAEPLIGTLEQGTETGMWAAPSHSMPPATYSMKERARQVKGKIATWLAPADSKAIAGHVTLLLQHYYRDANIPPAIAEGLALQWLECLEEFPEWAVKAACVEYLKNDSKGRKPSPGQVVALARQQVSKYHALSHRCSQIIVAKPPEEPRKPPTEEEKRRVSEMLSKVLKSIKGAS